jgi:hypothetical protein
MTRYAVFSPRIDAQSPQGTLGRLKLSDLKPTQNAVGMDEVNAKVANIKDKSDSALEDYLLPRAVPVIIGNDGSVLPDRPPPSEHLAVARQRRHGHPGHGHAQLEFHRRKTLLERRWLPITGCTLSTPWAPGRTIPTL